MARIPNSTKLSVGSCIALALMAAMGWEAFQWTVCRVYVPVGSSLLLRYKGPLLFGKREYPPSGHLALIDDHGQPQIGILEQMPGPGRHFYCPLWWECTLVKDTLVEPAEVAVIASKVGDDASVATDAGGDANQFLVEGDLGATTRKGVLRKVYGPGRYRINPYAYDVRVIKTEVITTDRQAKYTGWVRVPTGCVGVVTNQTNNPLTGARKGIQRDVLPPGLYPMNPYEQTVDIVEIGYREKSINSSVQRNSKGEFALDAAGEPIMANDDTGIVFPSKDGFTIHMDFTAIWGIMPEQAARIVEYSGTIEAVETRVVVPLIESICRNEGSKLGAVELLVGDTREQFQEDVTRQFEKKLKETGVALQYGLVRHIYIPQDVRVPIQQAFLADELKLTRDQEQITTRTEANLREAEQKVLLESERILVETEKAVAQVKAEGDKEAAETRAGTIKLVAQVDKETAELEAQSTVALGRAKAESQTLMEEARAGKFQLAVEAFGSGAAYNKWVFATNLPEKITLQTLYAGPGTLWTDLKGFTDAMLGKQAATQRPAK